MAGFALLAPVRKIPCQLLRAAVLGIDVAADRLVTDTMRLGSIDRMAAGLSALALVAVFRLNLGMATVLAAAAMLGLVLHLVGLT